MNTENFQVERVNLADLALYKNPRKDLKDIKGLAATIIAAGGILQPLKGFYREVEPGVFKRLIVDGQRRFTALHLLQEQNEHGELLYNIPFIRMDEGMSDSQILAYQILSNEGEPLTPLELGESIAEMLEGGKMKISEVAESLGKSKVYVAELNKLAGLPEYIKALIKKGTLSATLVREQIKAGTLDAFIANINENGVDGEYVPSTDITGEIEKEVNASNRNKITASDLKVNSVQEFKKFAKGFSETFADKNKQATYEFVTDIVRNMLSYEDILNYFSDEKTAQHDTDEKRVLRERADQQTGRNKKGSAAASGKADTAGTEAPAAEPTAKGGEGQETAPKAENKAFDKIASSLLGGAEEKPAELPDPVEVAAPAKKAAPKKEAAPKKVAAKKEAAPKKAAAKKEAAPKKVASKTAPSKSTVRKIGYDKQSGKIAE